MLKIQSFLLWVDFWDSLLQPRSLCSWGWPWPSESPASTSGVPRLEACIIAPDYFFGRGWDFCFLRYQGLHPWPWACWVSIFSSSYITGPKWPAFPNVLSSEVCSFPESPASCLSSLCLSLLLAVFFKLLLTQELTQPWLSSEHVTSSLIHLGALSWVQGSGLGTQLASTQCSVTFICTFWLNEPLLS